MQSACSMCMESSHEIRCSSVATRCYCRLSRVVLRVHILYDILPPATIVLQVESKSAATELEARAILHLQQMGLARVLNLRVGGRAR